MHTVVQLCRRRWPARPVDMLSSAVCAPLVEFMPGVRKAVVGELPRGRLAMGEHRKLAARLRAENYGTALIMPRKWKAALAPWLAGIPDRVGFVGEFRYGLLTDARGGERALSRMIDRCAALVFPAGAPLPAELPEPHLAVPPAALAEWHRRTGIDDRSPIVAVAPGAIGRGRRWPTARYAELTRRLTATGVRVWVLGSPAEQAVVAEVVAAGGALARDLTCPLRDAVFALSAADVALCNDSGLLHIAAAVGTKAICLYGPTDPRETAPLNPLAAMIRSPTGRAEDIPFDQVYAAVQDALTMRGPPQVVPAPRQSRS
jgi:heptosyltransferase-2